jgi:hypothetical protein
MKPPFKRTPAAEAARMLCHAIATNWRGFAEYMAQCDHFHAASGWRP